MSEFKKNKLHVFFLGQQQSQRKMVVSKKKLIKVGPWGGAGGHPWDDGGYSGIRSITMSYDRFMESISVEYDRDGMPVTGERHGGAAASHTTQARPPPNQSPPSVTISDTAPSAGWFLNRARVRTQIKLGYPDEYLTTVSGHYAPIAPGGSPVIRSLAFRTNQGAYGPFGVAEGTPFEFPVDGGVIVGFCGRSGWQLDAVGLYVAPLRPETVYDRVHKLGLTAYRAVWQRIGSQQQQQEPVKLLNGNAQITHKM
jgi:hypothetical protein